MSPNEDLLRELVGDGTRNGSNGAVGGGGGGGRGGATTVIGSLPNEDRLRELPELDGTAGGGVSLLVGIGVSVEVGGSIRIGGGIARGSCAPPTMGTSGLLILMLSMSL